MFWIVFFSALLLFDNSSISGVKNYRSKWFYPYSETDSGILKTTMDGSWTGTSGVYQIKAPDGEIIYVGSSISQLKKTIYRHFQEWTDRSRTNNQQFDRVVYPKNKGYKVKFFICSPDNALRAEKYLIRKLKPRDNPIKYYNLNYKEVEKIEKANDKIQEAEVIAFDDLPW